MCVYVCVWVWLFPLCLCCLWVFSVWVSSSLKDLEKHLCFSSSLEDLEKYFWFLSSIEDLEKHLCNYQPCQFDQWTTFICPWDPFALVFGGKIYIMSTWLSLGRCTSPWGIPSSFIETIYIHLRSLIVFHLDDVRPLKESYRLSFGTMYIHLRNLIVFPLEQFISI